jgi:hypothetical protein
VQAVKNTNFPAPEHSYWIYRKKPNLAVNPCKLSTPKTN